MPLNYSFRDLANSQTGLVLACAMTVAVIAIVYNLSDEPLTADQPSVANPNGTRAVPTLQFVVAISRHGNRGPLVTYPNSPYQWDDTKVWPYGVEHLTQKGHIQMFNLGKKFRSLYNGFLGVNYRPGEFQALSTLTDRTLQSAELFLAGLFPPSGFQVWNKDLLWQPVPVFPNLLDRNDMVMQSGPNLCPKFREAQNKPEKQFEQENDSELDDLVEYVQPYLGYGTDKYDRISKSIGNVPRIFILFSLWESFAYPEGEGLPLPDWSKKVYPEPITSLLSKLFQASAIGSYEQIRYLEGEMFEEIVDRMLAKVTNTLESARQMVYYSGHDHTLLGLLAILGLTRDLGVVRPGSALVLELHKDSADQTFYVQVLYIDGASPDLEPSPIDIPDCGSPCGLRRLLNFTEKYYNITDYQKECEVHPVT
uniref:acid phosphatase n=1 Tax=Graphocephala atropunctata TaxID=36148 RepID=A0A1B6L861_9HEMI